MEENVDAKLKWNAVVNLGDIVYSKTWVTNHRIVTVKCSTEVVSSDMS